MFYCQAKKYHPDTSTECGEKFKQINTAYEILSNKELKRAYDQERNFDYEKIAKYSQPYEENN